MARTSNVFARVEPKVKEQAETVLNQLGIPFEMKFPANKPLDMSKMTKEQFDAEIQKGITDIENGRVYSAYEVEEEMHRLYGV